MDNVALYFGCWDRSGHYLHDRSGSRNERELHQLYPDLPWSIAHMDTGLLRNGRREDVYDGRVFWTVAARLVGRGQAARDSRALWHAFVWWDNSVDKRGGSNSGFYVRGFEFGKARQALEFACSEFPRVVSRQLHPLILQE